MAKYTHLETRPIVTLDYGHGPYSYYAASGERTIGGDGSLFFEHMALTPLSRATVQEHPAPTEAPTSESGLTPAQNQALKLIAGKARHVERQIADNARLIEEAHEQANANLSSVAHDFNMCVLGATHEGLRHEVIVEYLESQGLKGLDHTVSVVGDRDWDMLYPSVVE